MADNNDLKVIVGLNIPQSVVEIEDDLKIIEKTLANSDEGKLKITAGLNVGKTIGIINKQLSELKINGSRLKITPTIDINTNNIKTSDISRSFDFDKITKYIKQEFGYAKGMTKQSTDEIKQELMSISETFGKEPAKFEASFNKIWNIFQSYGNKIRKSKAERDADIQNVIDQYGFAPIKNIQANSKLQGKDPNISKYWYDRVVDAFGDENEARKAIKTVFGYIKVGVEGELKASMHKLDVLFGEYKDRVTGQVYANGGADGFRQYYEDLMKARSWTKDKSFVDTTNDDYEQATLRELIEKSLGLVNANKQLVQSNEQVAQSERDVAQAQREVNNATQSASANNGDELLKKKEELANKLLASENNVLAIEKQLATQGQELTRLRAQEAEVFPFGEEVDQLNRQIQEAQSRYNATKQMLDNENSTHTALNEQLNAILGQIEQEKQRLNQSTQNMGSASGAGVGTSSEYLSSNISKITSVTNSAKEAEQSFKNTIAKNFNQVSHSVEKVISDLDDMSRRQIFNTHSNDAGVIQFQSKIKGLSDTAKQVKADLDALGDSKVIPPELKARADELKKKFDELNGSNKILQGNLRQNDGWARTERQIQTLTARIKEYMAVNTKAAKKYSGQFDGLLSGLSQAEINKDSEAVRRLSADFQILRSQIKAAGDQGKTLGQMIVDNAKRFSMWFSLTSNIMRAWRTLKQMVTTVKELDTAMTALKRVTEGTSATYNKFLETAIKNAKELKMDLVDLVTQSAEWAKRGYSLEEAGSLARASGIYSVVADIDNATAVQHLTTVMKTYNMTVEEAMDVTDRLDNIANRYAVTAGDLGEILSHSISSMQVSGNTLDQAIAMGTAIAQITGNANEAGSTLKVLSMRLRGASTELINAGEDTEGMAESTSKLREKIMALTNVNGKGGFDIMLDNDTFKSTYEIMEGISKVWKDISDVNQANKICLYVQKCA